jgi:hypothetical protein
VIGRQLTPLPSRFKQRENCNSLYEQSGFDREILVSLKYPYCVIRLMNNYIIHNPLVCAARKKILGAGEEIIPKDWSSFLGDSKCNCNNDVYCRCLYLRPVIETIEFF